MFLWIEVLYVRADSIASHWYVGLHIFVSTKVHHFTMRNRCVSNLRLARLAKFFYFFWHHFSTWEICGYILNCICLLIFLSILFRIIKTNNFSFCISVRFSLTAHWALVVLRTFVIVFSMFLFLAVLSFLFGSVVLFTTVELLHFCRALQFSSSGAARWFVY